MTPLPQQDPGAQEQVGGHSRGSSGCREEAGWG